MAGGLVRRRSPYEALTDPANADLLGTITEEAWAEMAVAQAVAEFYAFGVDVETLQNPLGVILKAAQRSSGSIGGAHRGDLVAAIQGAQPQPAGLAIQPRAPGAEPETR